MRQSTKVDRHNWNRSIVDNAKAVVSTECAAADGKQVNANTHAFSILRRHCRLSGVRIHAQISDITRLHRISKRDVFNLAERALVGYVMGGHMRVPELFGQQQYRTAISLPRKRKVSASEARALIKAETGYQTHIGTDGELHTDRLDVLIERAEMNATRYTVLAECRWSDEQTMMDRDDAHRYLLSHLFVNPVLSDNT